MKVHIHVSLCGNVLEVDGCVVLVLGFAQIEGKLIVNCEVIVATLIHRISEIMVLGITFLTVVASNSLGCAKTITSPANNEELANLILYYKAKCTNFIRTWTQACQLIKEDK